MTRSQHKRPIWMGLLLATVAPSLPMLFTLFAIAPEEATLGEWLRAALVVLGVAVPVSLISTLALLLPYVLWLRGRNSLSGITVCSGAVIIGAIAFALLSWSISWGHAPPGLPQYLCGAGFGFVAGLGFCIGSGPVFAIRSRSVPDSA